MKIHPNQLEGVRTDLTTRTDRGAQNGAAFGDILSQEVSQSDTRSGAQAVTSSASLTPPGGLDALGALLGVQNVEATSQATQSENAIMDTVESVLDKWDQYAQNLQGNSEQVNLKQAYGVLDDIDGAVQQIKTDNPDLARTHPDLQNMVSDLEALTETERIKFNRGDYIA